MNRSMMPKQVMAYGNGGGISSLASVPMETTLAGQPHRLAYVNPQEEQMMLNAGGAGLPGPGGIPAYWSLFEPSTWAGGSNHTPGAGYEGLTSSSNDYQAPDGSASSGTTEDDNAKPGIIDSVLMGTGLKRKTAGFEAALAKNLANQQAQQELTQSQYNPTANDDNVQVSGGGGGGGGGGASTPVVVEQTVTPFTGLTDTQLGAQSEYLDNVATYLGQYDQNQLGDVTQRSSIYGSNEFRPTTEQFIAITGADEGVAQSLIRSIPQNDLRDWSKIMASDNPLEAAQAATAAYYMTPGLYGAGQTLHTGQMVDAVDNIIGETDQLYAYSRAFDPNSQYGVGDVNIGIKTPDGVQLTQLGPLSSPTFGENLARFGYGSEDLAELIPQIEGYYADNFKYVPDYQKVGTYNGQVYSDSGINFGYSSESESAYNDIYGDQFPIMGERDGVTYRNTNILTNPANDPFGYISNLKSYENPYTTSALDVGQDYLFQNTPGFYGQSPLNIIDEEVYYSNLAKADALQAAKAKAAAIAKAQAAGISSGTPGAGSQQNLGQNYSALVPAAGTSTQGIAGLPATSATNTPYAFTSYNPQTYNPVVGPLTLPPLA